MTDSFCMCHICRRIYFQQKKLGPGTYEIKDFLEMADGKPRSVNGICETKEERFKQKSKASKLTVDI